MGIAFPEHPASSVVGEFVRHQLGAVQRVDAEIELHVVQVEVFDVVIGWDDLQDDTGTALLQL